MDPLEANGAGAIADFRCVIHHLEDPVETDRNVLGPAPGPKHVLERFYRAAQSGFEVVVEAQVPDREAQCGGCEFGLLHDLHRSQGGDEEGDAPEEPEHAHGIDRVKVSGAECRIECFETGLAEGDRFGGFGPIGFDDLDSGEGFLDAAGQSGVGFPGSAKAGSHPLGEPGSRNQAGDYDPKEDQAKCRCEEADDHDRIDELRNCGQRRQDQDLHQLGHHGAVLGQAIHRVAHGGVRVEAQGQALEMGEQVDPQFLIDPLQNPDLVVIEPDEKRCEHDR